MGHYGGSVALADYCPYIQEFTWKSKDVIIRGSHCQFGENSPGLCWKKISCLVWLWEWRDWMICRTNCKDFHVFCRAVIFVFMLQFYHLQDEFYNISLFWLPDPERNFALESYTRDSKCFNQQKEWTERKCYSIRQWQHWGSGCYQYMCVDGRLHIIVANHTYTCYHANQVCWHGGNEFCVAEPQFHPL